MLLDVGEVVAARVAPALLTGNRIFVHLTGAFRSRESLGDIVGAARHLPAEAGHMNIVGVFVVDGEVVVNVSVNRVGADFPSAMTHRFERVRTNGPIRHIQVMDMLLDDVITTEPGEVVPVAQLPLHISPAFLLRINPDGSLIPVDACRNDGAEGAVVDTFQSFDIPDLMPVA